MAIAFGWHPLQKVADEPNFAEMVRAHWEEVGEDHAKAPLDFDVAHFLAMERAGQYRLWGAYEDKTLAGYIGWVIQAHPHYCTTLVAYAQHFYLDPAARKGDAGKRFFTSAEPELKRLGVVRCLVHEKVEFEAERGGLSRMFSRMGYRPFEISHIKVL